MRILQVNTAKLWRGGERQTLLLCRELVKGGHEVTVLCRTNQPLAARLRDQGIDVEGVRCRAGAALWLIGRGGRFDLIHTNTGADQSLAVFTGLLHRRPVLHTRRVAFFPRGRVALYKYARTARVVAISDAIRNILHGVGVRDVAVIRSAVEEVERDTERAERLVADLQLQSRTICATTASLTSEKAPLVLVDAVRRVWQDHPDMVFLHFGDGPMRAAVEKRIARLGLESAYRLMGHHDRVEDYFPLFRVFVLSSRSEGIGSKMLDTFLYRVPVAATTVGGLAGLVDGRGLLLPPGDSQALAANMSRLLRDEPLRERLREEAYRYVKEHHQVAGMARAYVSVYQDLLRRGR